MEAKLQKVTEIASGIITVPPWKWSQVWESGVLKAHGWRTNRA
jgi:hypothetical protein